MQEKISNSQLFYIMIGFEIGSTVIFGLGAQAKQDAWLVILTGMLCGLVLMWVYTKLVDHYPGHTLTQMIPKIVGRYIGYPLNLVYILYFIYLASRVARDFGELIGGTFLPKTPMPVVIACFMAVIVYCLSGGIEVFGRTGEVLVPFLFLVAIVSWSIVYSSHIFDIKRLTPILESGAGTIWKAAFPLVVTFPYGEMVLFMMFWPSLSDQTKVKKLGLTAVFVAGILLTINMVNVISVIGPRWIEERVYPLLTVVKLASVANFIERIDAVVIITMFIGGFFKVGSFIYGAAIGAAELVKKESRRSLVVLIGVIIVPLSLIIAGSYIQHVNIGLNKVPLFLHVPLQIVIPFVLLVIATIRKRYGSR
ncbi:GerAB/ArcD/ProY family transporter [Fictibacillus enclensis]|uniref:GerAB/ArcD/ProY family transporter n=1 Tax=Fictibacillus enclensis TaxID=1017270 RepID=UPI0024C0681E|nr:endospore germination permease [Fictibacillus enclensis]WHY73542.1 endospore germination permease [Fictibacillus enclensis]